MKMESIRKLSIFVSSGQKTCTRIISIILHSFLLFSRAIKCSKLPVYEILPKTVLAGAQKDKLQKLQISEHEILRKTILPVSSQFL